MEIAKWKMNECKKKKKTAGLFATSLLFNKFSVV